MELVFLMKKATGPVSSLCDYNLVQQ